MFKKSIKFILFSSLLASLPLQNYAGPIQWVKEKKQTYWDSLSTRKKIAIGAAAGLTVSGLMYYALQRNDWQLWNYLKHNYYNRYIKLETVKTESPINSSAEAELHIRKMINYYEEQYNNTYNQWRSTIKKLVRLADQVAVADNKLQEINQAPNFFDPEVQNTRIALENTMEKVYAEIDHVELERFKLARQMHEWKQKLSEIENTSKR